MVRASATPLRNRFIPDPSGLKEARCATLRPVISSPTLRNEAGIPEMGNGDHHSADRELARACVSGSERAWTEFYNTYHPLIEAVVRRHEFSSPKDVQEDLLQEIYESLVVALGKYDGRSSSLRTFVSMIAQRTCIDCWRGRSRMSRTGRNEPINHHDNPVPGLTVLPSELDPPDEQIAQAQFTHILRTALSSLSEACKELLKLRFFSNLTYEEMAEKLGKKTNSVNQQVLRCIASLRVAFTELEGKGQRA